MLKTIPDFILYEGGPSIPHDRNLIEPAPFLYSISFTLLSYAFLLIHSFLSGEESHGKASTDFKTVNGNHKQLYQKLLAKNYI